ncbi:Alpha-(1,3)-fucosyltransferase 11 [Linnemannia exigua]|uniref:Fucosyltransferase n=1 Tax=Linnemannia exigua TaxID=604196 RepID=A0AAD4DK86_9FUNG|nr:Alpha-(1,3)-fucosyltransferase 11 [Linnemannia exigua]
MDPEIMAYYKFAFALERVNCQDYVTQHLADALTVGAVPIVDGPADYSRFLPSAIAFIQVHAFIAPEQLAQEIDRLDRNDTLYIERMWYRRGHVGSGNGSEVVTEGEGSGSGGTGRVISALFRETFGGAPESALAMLPSATTTTMRRWTPDQHGVHCGICQLAHNLAKNTYNWTAHTQQRAEISNSYNNNNNSSSPTLGCESEPRYLPGLPAQMQAYDTFLESENDQAVLRQQQEMETLRQKQEQQEQEEQDLGQGDTTVMDPTNVHVVNVTVSFNSHNESDSSSNNATNQSSIIHQPSVVVLHQDVTSHDSSKSLQHLSEGDPAYNSDNTFAYATQDLGDSATTLPLSEVYYLLLLILAMFVGVGALVLILSKSARQKLLWPWRHLFYKKLPRDDPRDAAAPLSLERIMLRELGEDLLYD